MEIIIIAILFVVIEGIYINTLKGIPDNKKNLIFAWLVFFQLFLVAGLRSVNVYNDSISYASHFEEISPNTVFNVDFNDRFEVAYQILENFIHFTISKSPLALFLITSLLIQGSYVFFFYKNSSRLWFSIFLYLGLCHYFFVVSGIRQGIAIGIFNFAFILLIKRKWVWYLLLVILAAQFHSTAYLLIFLPLLDKLKLNVKILFIFIAVVLLGGLFLHPLLNSFFSIFSNYGSVYMEDDFISESKTGIISIVITYIIALFVVLRKFDFDNHTYKEKYMLFLNLLLLAFLVFSINFSILIRISYYFVPVSILALSNSCAKIEKNSNRHLMYFFWIALLTIQVIVVLTYRPDWYMVTPYNFFWD